MELNEETRLPENIVESLNLRFDQAKWTPTTIYNFDENLRRFANISVELYCMNTPLNLLYQKSPHFDILITVNGKPVTPDLVEFDSLNNPIRKVEFKTSLSWWDEIQKKDERARLQKIYGDDVEVEFLTLNHELSRQFRNHYHRSVYVKLLKEIQKTLTNIPRTIKNKQKNIKEKMPNFEEIVSNIEKLQNPEKLLNPDEFDDLIKLARDFLDHMDKMERFANANFMMTEEISEHLPKPALSNVFLEHPWSRDLNRIVSHKQAKENWGHTAQTLYEIIPNNLVVKSEPEDIAKYLKQVAPTELFGDYVANLISIEMRFKDEIAKIKQFLEMKAKLKQSDSPDTNQVIADKLKVVKTNSTFLNEMLEFQINRLLVDISANYGKKVKISKHGRIVLDIGKEKDVFGIYLSRKLKKNMQSELKDQEIVPDMYDDQDNNNYTLSKLEDKIYEKEARVIRKRSRVEYVQPSIYDKLDNALSLERNSMKLIDEMVGNTYQKSKTYKTAVEVGDWFKLVNRREKFQFPDYFKPCEMDLPTFENAYENLDLNNLSNELCDGTSSTIGQLIKSHAFSSVYSYTQFYRSIVAAMPRSKTKGFKMTEGSITSHPDGYHIFVTASPNGNVSGAIVLFGKIRADMPYPSWAQKVKLFPILNEDLTIKEYVFMTDPFRINLKVATSSQAHFSGFLSCLFQAATLNVDLTSNWLHTSLWWAFSRQLTLMMEDIYIMYKKSFEVGNFGKLEATDKFKGLEFRDVRISTIVHRLKEKYPSFVANLKGNLLNKRTLSGTIDAIFGFEHTSWHTLLYVCYLKQIYQSDDGYDPAHIIGGFFRDEMKYEDWYNGSLFHKERLDLKKHLPMDKFFNMLLKDERTWENLSYHPDVTYRLSELLIKKAQENSKTNLDPQSTWHTPAIKTGKATKVMIPSDQNMLYNTPKKMEETAKEKAKYEGILSSDLTEALVMESKFFKRHVDDKFLMFDESPWNGEYNTGDKMPSMIEMTLFEVCFYPTCMIMVMVPKDQKGYGKRGFFVQLVFNRNANKLWDESYRPILVTNPLDMILTPGTEKYILFQEKMKKIQMKEGHTFVSKDQSKFGDTYLTETFELLNHAALISGYLSISEFKVLDYFRKCLQHKIILMPWQNASSYGKSKNPETKIKVTDKENKWVIEMEKYQLHLNDESKWKPLQKSFLFRDLINNFATKKSLAFTLGVFNIIGTIFSIGYTEFMYLCLKELGLMDVMDSALHSDDAMDWINKPPPKRAHFETLKLQDMVFDLRNRNKIVFDIQGLTVHTDLGETYYGYEWITKLIIVIGLFVPRLVSQRPSLFKMGFGYAGEVLQTVVFSNRVFVPLIRYCSAIGQKLTGKSPASDTNAAIGRIYDILTNGGSQVLVAGMMIILNFMISDIYGLHQTKRHVNDPIEVGGLWWAIPARIFEEGFNANEVRLQGLTSPYIANKLQLLMNVSFFWKQKDKIIPEKDIDNTVLDDDDVNEAPKELATIDAGIEYRKDFKIRYNRSQRANQGLFKMIEMCQKEINSEFELLFPSINSKKIGLQERFKTLHNLWKIETAAGTNSFSKSVVNIMAKYTTSAVQENYAKTSADVALISMLGYSKRKIMNPFSEYINNLLKENGIAPQEEYKITDVWELVDKISRLKLIFPPDCVKGTDLIRTVLSRFIVQESNIIINDFGFDRIDTPDFSQHVYIKLEDKRFDVGYGAEATKALILHYEMKRKKLVNIRQATIVKDNPNLENNERFIHLYNEISALLDKLGFNSTDLENHFKLIDRILGEKSFRAIAAVPSSTNRTEVTLGMLWDFFKTKKIKVLSSDKDKQPDQFKVKSVGLLNMRFERVLAILNWSEDLSFHDYSSCKFSIEGHEVRIPTPLEIIQNMLKTNYNKTKANQLLASIMY